MSSQCRRARAREAERGDAGDAMTAHTIKAREDIDAILHRCQFRTGEAASRRGGFDGRGIEQTEGTEGGAKPRFGKTEFALGDLGEVFLPVWRD